MRKRLILQKYCHFLAFKSAYIYCTFFFFFSWSTLRIQGARNAARFLISVLRLFCTLLIPYSFLHTLFCLRSFRIFCYVLMPVSEIRRKSVCAGFRVYYTNLYEIFARWHVISIINTQTYMYMHTVVICIG